jgi:hypothetical protein
MKKYWIDKLKNTPLKGMQSVGREGAKVPVCFFATLRCLNT